MLKLFDLLKLSSDSFVPEACKLHFARMNDDGDDPLEVFKRGEFDEWQSRQTKRNFSRPFVVALLTMPGSKWLFAGIYSVDGEPPFIQEDGWSRSMFKYPMTRLDAQKAPSGRIIVNFDYRSRQTYPFAENHADELIVSEILSEPLSISDFNGFRTVDISMADLRVIVRQSLPDWRSALSSVKGIYLITDPTTGKAYVGKADGLQGLWGRFSVYAETIHGNNVGLIEHLESTGKDAALHWRLTILEVVDLYTSDELINQRETFWKTVLMTRTPNGLNHN